MMKNLHHRGLTVLELVVVACATILILGLILGALSELNGSGCAKVLKDATQLEQIHQSMVFYARENDGVFPTPGLIDRLPDVDTGVDSPGNGAEDMTLNHSAPLYSAMIAQNYFSPDLVIGPTEPSSHVIVKDDYDYMSYDPAADSYWDRTFLADVRQVSHTSYAHIALCEARKRTIWTDANTDSTCPLFSNRGPKNGTTSGRAFTDSITLAIHEDEDAWVGNVVFADNHVEMLDRLEPPSMQQPGLLRPFNLFRMDGGALGVSIASTEDDVTRVWDPLQ